jgi:hypothetical protein
MGVNDPPEKKKKKKINIFTVVYILDKAKDRRQKSV